MASRTSKLIVIIRRSVWKSRLNPVQSIPNEARSVSFASVQTFESWSSKHLPAVKIVTSRNKSHSSFGAETNFLYSLAFLSYAYTMAEDNQQISDSEIIKSADSFYERNECTELYEYLSKQRNSKNAEILWRYARAARDYSQLASTPKDHKRELIYDGYKAAEEAVNSDDNSFACHKWYGIMLSEIGDYEGTKKKIENSFKIRDHFVRAIELNKDDPTSHYLLGVWFFTFADLPWYQRKIAATIFASPPSCTYEEALQCFLEAESIEPGFYTANLLMLAKTCIRLGKKDEAKDWLGKLLNYNAKTESDRHDIDEGQKLLNTI